MKTNQFNNKNYYEILNLKQDASKEEIKKAYFSLCKKYHPDKCKEQDGEDKFIEITKAYKVLYNDESRAKYDHYLNFEKDNDQFEQDLAFNFENFDSSVLNFYFENEFEENYFVSWLANFSDIEKEYLYQHYWMIFWSGTYFTEKLLHTKNLTKIWNVFAKEINLTNINNNEVEQESEFYINEVDSIINSFKQDASFNFKSNKNFQIMAKIIRDNNFFDNEKTAYIALLNSQKTYELFTFFEVIYSENNKKSFFFKNLTLNKTNIYKQNKVWIGIIILIIVIIIIIFTVTS